MEITINTISTFISAELRELGAPNAVSYVRKSLSNKYKDNSKIHSESLLRYELEQMRENHSREKLKREEWFGRQNKRYIDNLISSANTILLVAKKLETKEFVGKLDPDVLDEHFTAWEQSNKLLKQMIDDRASVMPEKLHMLIYGFLQGTKSHAFAEYVKILLKTITITPKQTVRLLTGRVTQIESLYEPTNQFEARHAGFSGRVCDECGSWRLDKKYDTDHNRDRLFCYACKEWSDIQIEPLMEKEI